MADLGVGVLQRRQEKGEAHRGQLRQAVGARALQDAAKRKRRRLPPPPVLRRRLAVYVALRRHVLILVLNMRSELW